MNYKFEPKSTAYKLNLSNIKDESFIYELIIKLNTPTHYGINVNDSIMMYGDICTCDDGFLCEHRLQWIINFLVDQERIMKIKKIRNQ